MSKPLTLYVDSLFLSPYAMSAYVALTEKKLPFEIRVIDLAAGEQRMQPYLKRALTGRVPALTHNGLNLTESSAISEYLEDIYPPAEYTRLYPADPQTRAKARQVQAWLRSDLLALRQERSTETVFYGADAAPLSDTALAAATKLIHVAGTMLSGDASNLFGAWCLADTELALMLKRLTHAQDGLPVALQHYADMQWQRPAVQEWLKHNAAARG